MLTSDEISCFNGSTFFGPYFENENFGMIQEDESGCLTKRKTTWIKNEPQEHMGRGGHLVSVQRFKCKKCTIACFCEYRRETPLKLRNNKCRWSSYWKLHFCWFDKFKWCFWLYRTINVTCFAFKTRTKETDVFFQWQVNAVVNYVQLSCGIKVCQHFFFSAAIFPR